MLIAQLSDPHIQATDGLDGVLPADHLRRAIDAVNHFDPRPELVVLTGDLTNHGSPDEYDLLRRTLRGLRVPYRLISGNHDSAAELRAAFPEEVQSMPEGFVQYADEGWPIRVLALDTTVPRAPQGALCAVRLRWLEERLAEQPDRPTVILMHHPPFETGIKSMDAMGLLEGRDEFQRIVAQHSNVERILCGHLHRTIVCQVAGTIACTCPSVSHQIVLDLTENGRLAACFEPPGYLLHWVRPGATVTHSAVIGEYGGVHFA